MKMANIGLLTLLLTLSVGCGPKTAPVEPASTPNSDSAAEQEPVVYEPQTYEATAEQLLSARLSEEDVSQGWIRLFDGHTFFGWEIAGNANWHVEDETITVDKGEKCLICTSVPWQDYELTLEFNMDADTNSGVFLRTPLQVEDPSTECYEVNIAPDDNPFPTASVVQRQKVNDDAAEQKFGQWRRMDMRLQGNRLTVTIDGVLAADYTDPNPLAAGRIGLQYNTGRVSFRDIRLKPLGLKSLLDEDLSQWTQYPEMDAKFTANDEGWMLVDGGLGQIETKESYDDFVLLCEHLLPTDEVNSGIFFRCIPGDRMMGYECQLNHAMNDDMPLSPTDCGTGGIFRRQDARVIAGESGKWASLVLLANGPKMAAWVNGVQVSNWRDERAADENPRKGLRLEAGTLMIQGHDPTTKAEIKQFSIAPLKPGEPETETP